jgi:signal transduction histidine kinase
MRRTPRLIGPVLLLFLAIVVAAGLAVQAWVAARSTKEIADHTLHDYASFADWQLTQQAKNMLLATVVTSLSTAASRVDPDRLESTVLPPAQVEDMAREMAAWCRCLGGVHYFFRYDMRDGTLRTTSTEQGDGELAWARDTILAYIRAFPDVKERPIVYGSPDARYGPLKQLAVLLTNDSYVMLFGQRDGKPQLLVFVIARDRADAKPIVLYGYETDPGAFLSPIFTQVRRQSPLLPTSLVGDTPLDSVLSVSVTTWTGEEVYRSPGYSSPSYTATDTLEDRFGNLLMRVGLKPEIADKLIVGGLPPRRLPQLIGLFLLSSGLLTVALVQLRRQQELARLRSDFVSGVSHELRTPLAQIRWFAELLHLGKLRSEDERVRSAAIIDQEARRLTYLVENVMSFSRSERGAYRITPTPLDLQSEISEIVELFAPLARARRMTVRTDVSAGIIVSADRHALRQVVLNLLDNAVKYGPPGQAIVVTTEAAGNRARIIVEDEGPGIPNTERLRVWEPYVRLTRSVETATGGSGIGLAVVHELVNLHGGRARAETAPGGGARLVIELPLVVAEQHPGPDETTSSNGHVPSAHVPVADSH